MAISHQLKLSRGKMRVWKRTHGWHIENSKNADIGNVDKERSIGIAALL